MWIGLDDTDSREGGCTTYVCFEFVSRLHEKGYCLRELPRLIRLNPQVPWKTRGNGAIAVHIGKTGKEKTVCGKKNDHYFYVDPHASSKDIDKKEIIGILREVLDAYAEMDAEQTNPAFVVSSTRFPELFYKKAVHQLVTMNEAVSMITQEKGSYTLLKNGRGVIGAAAALSWDASRDHTYEIICYRHEKSWKTPREVDDESVKQMDASCISTFDNYDYTNGYNSIVPHSPCPILFGIRGDDPKVLPDCARMIVSEPRLGWMLFLSNQGTDDHIKKKKVSQIKSFQSVRVRGEIASLPLRKQGGHIFFCLKDVNGGCIDCAAYEPTKEFREIIEALSIGDQIEVYGGIRDEPVTINIEKIELLALVDVVEKVENPVCPVCGKHMKSKGKGQGYFCKPCKTMSDAPRMEKKKRLIDCGFYEVPVCARRHLARPLKRMRKEPLTGKNI